MNRVGEIEYVRDYAHLLIPLDTVNLPVSFAYRFVDPEPVVLQRSLKSIRLKELDEQM